MTTIAWLMIVTGAILIRQVAKGRTFETAEDLKDMFIGVVSADWDSVQEAAQRTGTRSLSQVDETAQSEALGNAVGNVVGNVVSGTVGAVVLQEMVKLGKSAKGYRFGTLPPDFGVGPNWYDCSGIVWRAMKNLGLYSGPRFTTFSWPSVAAKGVAKRISKPMPGAIVVWDRGASGHMGIVTGEDKFFSALSSKGGIKEARMSAIKGSVSYWQLTGQKV